MNITEVSIKNPYIVITLSMVVAVMGLISFFKTPVDLFPDTTPPQVLIVTVEPGATAQDISDKITEIIEKEVSTISGVKRIRSTSRDEVSTVLAEFLYTKNINDAVSDVSNAIERIRAELPSDILPISIYKITDATKPTMTIALSPREGSKKSLATIRLLAENDIRDAFLQLKEVGDVDVFGGYIPEIKILVNRDKLRGYNLTLMDVISAISRHNVSIPGGYIYTSRKEYLVRTTNEFKDLDEIKKLPIKEKKQGFIYLEDVASVFQGVQEKRSLYHGNGHPAIAINILRPENGHTIDTIKAAKKLLQVLKKRYPDIKFEITNDQQPIVDINLKGMRNSIWQAIILTVLIIFLFLADKRASAIISLSIPMAFLFSLMILKFSPYTMNMVTLSGLIIAVGMVVDASIVVLENIFRHFTQNKELSGLKAAIIGTKEVTLANTAGMLTTIIVLFPVMFTGGYPQQVLRPLSIIISSTIFASLIASLTIVPLIASRILRRDTHKKDIFECFADKVGILVRYMSSLYVYILKWALKHKGLIIIITIGIFIFTMRVVSGLLVGELMPPMDTGIVKISIDMPSEYNIDKVESLLYKVENIIKRTEGYVSMSSIVGSEPGEVSFGQGAATVQQAFITVNLITRDKRDKSIWQIEEEWRERIKKIKGIRAFKIVEFGATPLSTTKAPFDLIIKGKDSDVLDQIAYKVLRNIKGTKGLVDISRSWYKDKAEIEVIPDSMKCQYYGISTKDLGQYLKFAIKGAVVSQMRLKDFLDIPIRVEYDDLNLNNESSIGSIYIPTRFGQIPLRNIVKIKRRKIQPFITRENMQNTIDITGINRIATIYQATQSAIQHLKKAKIILPEGYSFRVSGTPEDMLESRQRLGKSLLFGIILLYFLLVPLYKSFSHPLVIMSAIPLAAIGAFWGLLIFDKPMCMPAFMGMILLAGTIVNNSILLLDFILTARAKGMPRDEAIINSVKIRTRPILMTASSTVIGLTPLIFEMAVGLERLSPLGIVAASGLILGTFFTMIVIPVIYASIDDIKTKIHQINMNLWGITVITFITIAFSFNCSKAIASSPSQTTKIKPSRNIFTLPEAIRYALKHSPDIEYTKANIISAKGIREKLKSSLLPRLDIVGSYIKYQTKHTIIPGIEPRRQRFDDRILRGKLKASLLITDFGKSYYSYKSTKDAYMATVISLERRKELIIYNVANIYFEIKALQSLYRSLLAQKKSLLELKKRMELFFKNGKIAKVDLLKVNVRLSSIKDRMEHIKKQKIFLTACLAEEIGYEDALEIDNTHLKLIKMDVENLSIDTIFSIAMKKRKDLKSLKYTVQAAKAKLTSAKRSLFPQMYLVAEFGEFSGFSEESRFRGNHRWDNDAWVGININIPIFDSGLRHGQILMAKGKYKEKIAQEKKIRLTIYKDIRKSLAAIKSAKKRIQLAKDSIEEAKETLRVEMLKYKCGKGNINDVLDAEASVYEAEALLYEAISDYNVSIFELKLAEGDLLEEYSRLIFSKRKDKK